MTTLKIIMPAAINASKGFRNPSPIVSIIAKIRMPLFILVLSCP
ncbi:hypothetical protein LPICM17_500100 [Lactococcus piscium]|nr:hypothetical protein LP2241_30558 [Lactococcus piscium]SOB48161.1 hypothetical protein LPICM17_500100 [Lactococcus piscium]